MELDDTDEDVAEPPEKSEKLEEKAEPLKLIERPRSPDFDNDVDVFQPIRLVTNPRQLISREDLKQLDDERKIRKYEDEISRAKSKSFFPSGTNGKTTSVTLTIGGNNGASKRSIMRAINGLAKLLKIEAPKHWILEDRKSGRNMDVLRTKDDDEPMDMFSVIANEVKVCRNCEVVLRNSMVKRNAAELPFLSRQEREEGHDVFFCDSNCYFQFSISKTEGGKLGDITVSNLDQLVELQESRRKKQMEEENKRKEKTKAMASENGPIKSGRGNENADNNKHKGKNYKMWSAGLTQQRKHKKLSESELTQMMFRMG